MIDMIRISTRLRYGIRFLMALSCGEKKSTSEIAGEIGVSPFYLRQIANVLERNEIIESERGARGGYKILKKPDKITIFELCEILDEDLNFLDCIKNPQICNLSENCRNREMWKNLSEMLKEKLRNITLKDLIEGRVK